MGYKPIEEIQKETRQWDFIQGLPDQVGKFSKKLVDIIDGQILTICRYEAPELRPGWTSSILPRPLTTLWSTPWG